MVYVAYVGLFFRVTTAGGERYLVHNGKGYGKSGQTVVVDAKHMSNNWKVICLYLLNRCSVSFELLSK